MLTLLALVPLYHAWLLLPYSFSMLPPSSLNAYCLSPLSSWGPGPPSPPSLSWPYFFFFSLRSQATPRFHVGLMHYMDMCFAIFSGGRGGAGGGEAVLILSTVKSACFATNLYVKSAPLVSTVYKVWTPLRVTSFLVNFPTVHYCIVMTVRVALGPTAKRYNHFI